MDYNKSEIAKKTGLSRQAVSNILNGRQRNPRINSIKKIAEVLGCSVDDLLKEK